MRQTPLYDDHLAGGGKVVDFHGWALPIQFAGIIQEHQHTRARASLFDCSHMGEIRVAGRGAIEGYGRLVISDVGAIPVGRGRYGAILNEQGGIIDDVITIRLAEDELLVVTNAGPVERVAALVAGAGDGVADISADTAKIDLQGPMAREVLLSLGLKEAGHLRYFNACKTQWRGEDMVLSRMGYTGELGFECYVPNGLAHALWNELLGHEVVEPAGLGARDTLRLEMGYPLSGQDFDEGRTPIEAGQEGFVAWDSDFVGKAALVERREAGNGQVLRAIRTPDRRAPRHGFAVYSGEEEVGTVTSGTFGPSVGFGIGLAYLNRDLAVSDVELTAGPRRIPIEIVDLPFYREGTCRG